MTTFINNDQLNNFNYFFFSFNVKELPYRVVIFPSKKSGAATTSANVWVAISGSLSETQQVQTPRGTLEFVFHVKRFLN